MKLVHAIGGIVLGTVGFALFVHMAFAAPTSRLDRTVFPEADSTYELGTSTQAWLRVTTDEVCLTGDTCRTSWPTSSGTVTSVALTVPTGLSISGSPITTSGTLAISLSSGYLIPLSASTTNWNNFYDTPSGRITAGTALSWSANTLNFVNPGYITDLTSFTTDDLTEGSTNKYWSQTLFDQALTATTTLPEITTLANLGTVKTSLTGILKASSGVLSAAASGTDYAPATSGSAILKGNGSGGFSNASNGTDYTLLTAVTCSNQALTALTASGGSTCSSITDSYFSGALGIAHGGTATTTAVTNGVLYYDGSKITEDPSKLSFTGTNFGIASTSPAFTFSVNTIGSQFYISSTGKVVAYDTTNGLTGVLSPTRSFTLSTGTTTTWTASTTGTGYSPSITMPFTGTLRQVRCTPYIGASAGSFIGVNVKVNGSDATPSYFVASSTIGTEHFTSGNTFSAGQPILANFGTSTTATATRIDCTFDVTETP